jgi:hypothetical protein
MRVFSVLILAVLFVVSCGKTEKGLSEADKKMYMAKGKEVAQSTFELMGGKVKENMKKGGPNKAVPFCNEHANELAEKMSKKYNVSIKRTSLELRNDKNAPNEEELEVLSGFKKTKEEGGKLKPIVKEDKTGHPHFYAPIIIKKKCLACHGVLGEKLVKKTDSLIKSHYPKDLAIGYKEGDLRGIWSITFADKE